MKGFRILIAVAGVFFVLALVVAWRVSTNQALRNTEQMLVQSETVFEDFFDDSVDSVLWHTALLIEQDIGGSATALSQEECQALLRRFQVDELAIADANGMGIASSEPSGVGYDFRANPATANFVDAGGIGRGFSSQPFHESLYKPGVQAKSLSIAFKDGSGFLQLGFYFSRLLPFLQYRGNQVLVAWKIGRFGHFDFFDADRDGGGDYLPDTAPDGVMLEGREGGKTVFCRAFRFGGQRYVSVMPMDDYFEQRNLTIAVLAPMMAVIVLVLVLFVYFLVRANQAGAARRAAEDAARRRDLGLARTIQTSSLASADFFRKAVFTLTFDAVSRPAREVGGDFYDFYFIDASRMAFVMADVAGKGVPAALFMMEAKSALAAALAAHHDPVEAVTDANRRLCEHNLAEMFVTAWVGVMDVRTGEMEYVNAGHNRPLIRRAGGKVSRVAGKGGLFLGMFPDAKYRSESLKLAPGDLLFLFTDGVTEAMNPAKEAFGERRLSAALAAAGTEPSAIIRMVGESVAAFAAGAEKSDDLTALALVWHGRPARQEKSFAASEASFAPAMAWAGEAIGLREAGARARLLNALDEIMTNAVHYSGASEFSLLVENAPGRTRVTISDDGREYNPLSHIDPDTSAPLEERPIGGLGILMAKKLADSAGYRREEGRNWLTLVKTEGWI